MMLWSYWLEQGLRGTTLGWVVSTGSCVMEPASQELPALVGSAEQHKKMGDYAAKIGTSVVHVHRCCWVQPSQRLPSAQRVKLLHIRAAVVAPGHELSLFGTHSLIDVLRPRRICRPCTQRAHAGTGAGSCVSEVWNSHAQA